MNPLVTAAAQTELSKRFAPGIRANLFDIQRADGATFFWSDVEIVATSRLTGAAQHYQPWVKTPPTIKSTRSLQADGGQFVIQNLSGNLIDRDVSSALKSGEFEGAYVIYQRWIEPLDAAVREFHGSLTQATDDASTDDVTFTILQLANPNDVPIYEVLQTRACNKRFTSAQCGYRRGQLFVPLTTATAFSASTIGASGLAMTPNLYADELVMILSGTGAGQERYVLSHTATTLTLKTNWTTTPDATSKFIVTGPGTMKVAATAPNIFSSTTIGNSSLARTVNGDTDAAVYIISGTGHGQNRQIASNTATTFTLTKAWTTTPDGSSVFVVVYRDCAFDRDSCNTRGVIERFPGIIFLAPTVTTVNGPTGVGTGGAPSGGSPRSGGGSPTPISRLQAL